VRVDRSLAYRYGVAIKDPMLRAFGASGATEASVALDDRSIGRAAFALFGWKAMSAERTAPTPLPRDVWLPNEDMQMMAARDREGSDAGFFVAAWGSHNNQSHNHNDVGNAIVFADGAPVLIDLGRPEYTAQTFSNRRYEIREMQSAFHNLPTINGAMQFDGRKAEATGVTYTAGDASAELRMDISHAYPAAAAVTSWLRKVQLNRGRNVTITDTATLARASKDVSLNLITPCDVNQDASTLSLRFSCAASARPGTGRVDVTATFNAASQVATIERIAVTDPLQKRAWGDHVTRIVLSAKTASTAVAWTLVLSK
jgi:hypothetical protein